MHVQVYQNGKLVEEEDKDDHLHAWCYFAVTKSAPIQAMKSRMRPTNIICYGRLEVGTIPYGDEVKDEANKHHGGGCKEQMVE